MTWAQKGVTARGVEQSEIHSYICIYIHAQSRVPIAPAIHKLARMFATSAHNTGRRGAVHEPQPPGPMRAVMRVVARAQVPV